jgi:hypothetical protein
MSHVMPFQLVMVIILVVVVFPGGLIAAEYLSKGTRTGPFFERYSRRLYLALNLVVLLVFIIRRMTNN